MSEEEALDVLENKASDHVTADEVEKKADIEKDNLSDGSEQSKNDGSSAVSELKAELSGKFVSSGLEFDSAECSLNDAEPDVQKGNPSKDQENQGQYNDISRNINNKMTDMNLSSKQEEGIPTQVDQTEVQNEQPPPPPQEILSANSNTLHVDSSGFEECKTRSPTLEHKDLHSRITAGSVTDMYDVISRKEVQTLNEWENIHKDCLSEIPPIDPGALQDIERRAKEVASNLEHLLGTLNTSLKSLSVIGVQSVDTYKSSVENVEVTVDASIKSMYTLISKCEKLHSYVGPLYSLSAQIKDIKRTLDVFESVCK